jgi:hypothetical protein
VKGWLVPVEVRRVRPEDWAAWKAIRQELELVRPLD